MYLPTEMAEAIFKFIVRLTSQSSLRFDDFYVFFIKHAIWRVFYWKICTYQLKWRKRYPNSSLGWLHHPHYVQCTDIGHHHLPTNGYKWWAVLVSKTSMHFTMEPNYLWDELKKSNCFVYVSIFDRKIHTSCFCSWWICCIWCIWKTLLDVFGYFDVSVIFKKFCLKIAKIEYCLNWKLLGLQVVKIAICQNCKLP